MKGSEKFTKRFTFFVKDDTNPFLQLNKRPIIVHLHQPNQKEPYVWAYFLEHHLLDRFPAVSKEFVGVNLRPFVCPLPYSKPSELFVEMGMLKSFVLQRKNHLNSSIVYMDDFIKKVSKKCEEICKTHNLEFCIQEPIYNEYPVGVKKTRDMRQLDRMACKTTRDYLLLMEQRLMLHTEVSIANHVNRIAIDEFKQTPAFNALVQNAVEQAVQNEVKVFMAREMDKISKWKQSKWTDARADVIIRNERMKKGLPAGKEPAPSPEIARMAPSPPPPPTTTPVEYEVGSFADFLYREQHRQTSPPHKKRQKQ